MKKKNTEKQLQNDARDGIRSHLASMDGEQSFRRIYLFDSNVQRKRPSAYKVERGEKWAKNKTKKIITWEKERIVEREILQTLQIHVNASASATWCTRLLKRTRI